MNSSIRFLAGAKRAMGGALLLVALFIAGSSAAEPQRCGCEEKVRHFTWPVHLALYDEMEGYVQKSRDCYKQASEAAEAVREDWKDLEKTYDDVSSLQEKIDKVSNVGRELQSQINTYVTRDNIKAVSQMLPSLEKFFKDVKELKGAWEQLNVGTFTETLGVEVRKEEKHYQEFVDSRKRFGDWYEKADRAYYTTPSLPCIKREYESIKMPKNELTETMNALETGRKNAGYLRQSLGKSRGAVEAALKDCNAWRTGVARAFGLPAEAGEEEIVREIKDQVVDRVKVQFRNVKDMIDSIELKSGLEELVEPDRPFVGDGPKFRYWKERSKDEEFKEWNTKISRNLDLEAVWGYEIHVAGIDSPLMFPVERWDVSLPSSRVLGSTQLKDCAEKLKSGTKDAGRVFRGWATAADPNTRLTERSGNIRNGTTLQALWTNAVYIVTYVVPGGTPPPPQEWEYSALGPFPVPPPLPANAANGFSYVRWSLDENGTEEWTGGVALTNNITVYAVREADYRVFFHDEDGTVLSVHGAKKGKFFAIPPAIAQTFRGGNSTLDKGRVFVEWKIQGTDDKFESGVLKENVDVVASYRDETPEEMVRRIVKPVESKVGITILAVADAALLALLITLLLTGRGKSPKSKEQKEESADENVEGGSGEAGAASTEEGKEPQGDEGPVA